MDIIPVIDLKGGVVVRGIAGQRSRYCPISSLLADEPSPQLIATGLIKRFGFPQVYVADLDAIAGGIPDWALFEQIASCGIDLWIDFGCRTAVDIDRFLEQADQSSRTWRPVVGLESVSSPAVFEQIASQVPDICQAIFSLDLIHGLPLVHSEAWSQAATFDLAEMAIQLGFQTIIVLDLAAVGTRSGPATLELIAALSQQFPSIEWIAGGGTRSEQDLLAFRSAGCSGTLVASALHDGQITKSVIDRFHT